MQHKYPKLRILSNALRGEMPEDFEWNFEQLLDVADCGSVGCALGYGISIGLIKRATDCDSLPDLYEHYAAQLDMHPKTVSNTFFISSCYPVGCMSEVTPTMVADEIDQFIAEHV